MLFSVLDYSDYSDNAAIPLYITDCFQEHNYAAVNIMTGSSFFPLRADGHNSRELIPPSVRIYMRILAE